MDTKHTPGPLAVALRRLAGNAGALGAFEHEIRMVVGSTNWQALMDSVRSADAALLAATTPTDAAPDLLASAKELLEITACDARDFEIGEYEEILGEARQNVRRAIAKATGAS